MRLAHLVEQFAGRCRTLSTGRDLLALTQDVASELGFSRIALVHHSSFRQPGRGLVRLDTFGEWAEVFVERRYYLDDPALLAAQRTNTAFSWSAIGELIPLGDRHREILAEAARHGLGAGLTVPVGVVGEPHGCCSFAASRSPLPGYDRLMAAALIGAEAFQAARRLHGFPGRARPMPRLSRRKLECLRYAAIGKTDHEIAIILGLRVSTIRSYMAGLRRDFGVVSRAQLVAAALRDGFIGYDDTLDG